MVSLSVDEARSHYDSSKVRVKISVRVEVKVTVRELVG